VSRLFLTHSSVNNAEAVALRDWLGCEGWKDEIFLDLDPQRGIAAGERWERALNEAANRCEAVRFLVSKAWLRSGCRQAGGAAAQASTEDTLGRVDGFDQDKAESERNERAVILRRLLASKCDTLEPFELADRLFDACPCFVEYFRKEGGHILGVGSIRDCRTYSALARGVAI